MDVILIHKNNNSVIYLFKILEIMKKVFMLAFLVLGTTAMLNAQTAPVKTVPAKEVKHVKHAKHVKKTTEKEEKGETKKMEKAEDSKAKK